MVKGAKKQVLALVILTLLGAGLRVYDLGGHGLWADEMFTLLVSSGEASSQLGPCFRRECDGNPIVMDMERFRRDFLADGMAVRPAAVVRDVYRYDPSHPPLYYMVVNLSIGAFGASEFALRLPSVLFGALTIPFLLLIGKRLHSAETGMLASAMFAFAPYELYFGQEARMYSMVLFLAVLSTWVLLEISDDSRANRRTGWSWWAAYTLTAVVGIYTTFLFILMFGVHFVIAVGRYRHDRVFLRNWFLAVGVCGLLFVPFFLAWLLHPEPPPTGLYWLVGRRPLIQLVSTAFENMLEIVWVKEIRPYKFMWLAILLTAIGTFVVVRRRIGWPIMWLMAPPAAVVGIDLIVGTHASSVSRYYILASPVLYLLVALGIFVVRPIALSYGLAGLVVLYLAIGGYSTVKGQIYPRLEFKEAARYISQTSGPEDSLVLISKSPTKVLGMSLAYYTASPETVTMLNAKDGQTVDWALLARHLRDHDRVTIATIYSWHRDSLDFSKQVTVNVPFLEFVEQRSYRGLEVFRYKKKGA